MARPPLAVMISASMAAERECREVMRCPISRKDSTDVISQNTYSTSMLSVVTSPSIAPAKAVREPANRPRPGSSSSK